MGKGEEMFAFGIVLLALGWIACRIGENPVSELLTGSVTNLKAIGVLMFLVGLLLMVASVSMLAWHHMP